jgi:hypothetical protein
MRYFRDWHADTGNGNGIQVFPPANRPAASLREPPPHIQLEITWIIANRIVKVSLMKTT